MSTSPRAPLPPFASGRRRRKSRGIALIVVLALVVIVSLLLVAFTVAMRLDRAATASYSQSIAAEQIGMGALNLVIGDLQKEMSADAPPDLTYPRKPLYTNVSSLNIQPQRIGTNPAMPNLVRISTNTSFKNSGGTVMPGLMASSINSGAASLNGRYVDTNRWNAPYLGQFPTTNSTPYWVYMRRDGPTDGAGATFTGTGGSVNNPALANTNFIIGRFAYAVYDEGGLVDITVAGYPTNLITPIQAQALKGTLAGVDLSALQIDAAALLKWRNAASAASGANYMQFMTNFAATNVFKSVLPGDTTFVSRMDLIRAAEQNVAGLNTNVLPNLGTFSRERNSPTWRPASPVGSTINYGANGNVVTSTNVFSPLVRYATSNTITSYHINGLPFTYDVQPGDPLLYRRFPLDRIRWIGPSGPRNGGTTESIKACFGLLWDPSKGVWKYVGPTGTAEKGSIKTLSEVLAESPAREPNFFEVLQAGMLSGSIGLGGHAITPFGYPNVNSFGYFTFHEKAIPLHVFRIGASILSQYEESSYPVVVEYSDPKQYAPLASSGYNGVASEEWQAVGLENLPYVNMLTALAGLDPAVANSLQSFILFGFWNPYQGSVASRPDIRLRVVGRVVAACYSGIDDPANPNDTVVYGQASSVPGFAPLLNLTLDVNKDGFADPHIMYATDAANSGAGSAAGMDWSTLTVQNVSYVGFRLPNMPIDLNKKSDPLIWANAAPAVPTYGDNTLWQFIKIGFNNDLAKPFNFWLEYKNPSGIWIPYSFHAGIKDPNTWFTKMIGWGMGALGPTGSPGPGGTAVPRPIDGPGSASFDGYYIKQHMASVDPRSLRFNNTTCQNQTGFAWSSFLNSSMMSSDTDPLYQVYGRPAHQNTQSIFAPVTDAKWTPSGLARNNNPSLGYGSQTSPAGYLDPDGVQRIADSGLFTANANTSGWQGDPYAKSATRVADRPIVLNRPFYSVGELGYVSRDYPWRTLDFFTDKSADSGLLDLFTVSQSDELVVPGKINLNSHNAEALKTALSNTVSDVISGTAISQPAQISSSLVSLSGTSALLGKDEIATKFVSSLGAANFATTDEQKIKARREGATRALVDIGQTRTWNLMIDVVAQSGRYSRNAKSLDQFTVEGERRYWLHVAIDRFTGEVIDQRVEPVTQ
ncbi:hypothetical protein BH09VER1_BH09VER1_27640 [soil metagenome]